MARAEALASLVSTAHSCSIHRTRTLSVATHYDDLLMPSISARRSFSQELLDLKNAARKVYKSATEVLVELQLGHVPTAVLRPDSRIPNCQKYELQDGYRLILQRAERGDALIALAVGKHEYVDGFLDVHRGELFDPHESAPWQLATTADVDRSRARLGGKLAHPPSSRRDVPEVHAPPEITRYRRAFFTALDDQTLAAIGVPSRHVPSLRAEYDGPDAPELLSALTEIQDESPILADLLLGHAVEPSNISLQRLLGLVRIPAVDTQASGTSADLGQVASSQGRPAPGAPDSRLLGTMGGPHPARRRRPKHERTKTKARGSKVRRSTPIHAKTKRKRTGKALAAFARRTPSSSKAKSPSSSPRTKVSPPRFSRRPTAASLKRYLDQRGFPPVDNRALGGGIWVLAQRRTFGPVAKELGKHGVQCQFFPAETRRKEKRPSWLIDAFKKLPS